MLCLHLPPKQGTGTGGGDGGRQPWEKKAESVSTVYFLSVTIKHTGTLTPCNDSTSLLLTLAALGLSIILSLVLYCTVGVRAQAQSRVVQ